MPGYYIVIDSPTAAGNNVEYANGNGGNITGTISIEQEDVDHTEVKLHGYHKLIEEIYRHKKSIQVESEDTGIFYEEEGKR